jgi:hypothetical protein
MPDGCNDPGDCLAAMYTDPLEEWIANGALEEEPEGGTGGAGTGGASSGGSGGTP